MLVNLLLILIYLLVSSAASLVSWELSAGSFTLLLLIHTLVTLIRNNTSQVDQAAANRPAKPLQQTTTTATKATNLTRTASKSKAATRAATQALDTKSELTAANLEAFARFRKNIANQAIQAAEPPPAPPSLEHQPTAPEPQLKQQAATPRRLPNPYQTKEAPKPPRFADELDSEGAAKVSISRPSAAAAPPKTMAQPDQPVHEPARLSAPRSQQEVAPKREGLSLQDPNDNDEQDLFADVRIELASESGQEPEDDSTPLQSFMDEGLSGSLKRFSSREEQEAEAGTLLNMAQTAFQARNYTEAKAGFDNYLTVMDELKTQPKWEDLYLYGRICLKLNLIEEALKRFEAVTTDHLDNRHDDYGTILEEIAQDLETRDRQEEAVPFLQKLLNYYRQKLDRPSMDRVYERLEAALEKSHDDEKLIRTYKNHLEIKRMLKDSTGESLLLDAIGNKLYKMGQKELSRQYYEESVRLKSVIER